MQTVLIFQCYKNLILWFIDLNCLIELLRMQFIFAQISFKKFRSRKPCKLFYLCNNIARNLEKIKVLKWKSMIWQKLYSKSFKSRYVRHLMDSHLIIARSSNALGAGSSKIIMVWNDFWRSIAFLKNQICIFSWHL